jgi:NitT/TauT family transport system permease protein
VNLQRPLARTLVTARSTPFIIDLGVAACALAVFFAVVSTGVYWFQKPIPVVPISSTIGALPIYAFYSIVRMVIAYMLSLAFALTYGYIAAYNARIEPWMVAVLDILQSIPVLSFLPPVVLAMVSLVPGHQLGIEMGVILLIFTGQVWNLAFSFYSSLKTIPREMLEASRIFRYSGWQRFWQLELPFSTIGLVWNSIVSVAGGWFALIFCETFTMGDRNFQLPGLGSYIQTATYAGDVRALLAGIATVILIVVATDQLVWRPLIAWSDKFKFEQVESAEQVKSPILELIRRSKICQTLPGRIWNSVEEPVCRHLAHSKECRVVKPLDETRSGKVSPVLWALALAGAMAVCWAAAQAVLMLRDVTLADLRLLLEGAAATFLRVNVALLISAAWTIPVGVDDSRRRGHRPQPAAGARCATHRADHGFGACNSFLPDSSHGAGPNRRRPGHRIDCAHVAGDAMVHPLQRDRRRHLDSLRPARGCLALSLHRLAALDQAHPSRHLSLPHHRHGHGLRRRVERIGDGRIFAREGADAFDHWPWRAN